MNAGQEITQGLHKANAEFDAYAANYDSALAEGLAVSGETKDFFAAGRIGLLVKWLHRLKCSPVTVLDYGCGTGSATPYLLGVESVQRLVGVDVSTQSLTVARQRFASDHVSFLALDDYHPHGEIDLAFCNGVFHHIAPGARQAAVRYIARCLKPDGVFAFWENNPWNPGARHVMRRIPFDRDAIMVWPHEAERLLVRSGLNIVGRSSCFYFPRALKWGRLIEPLLTGVPLGAQYLVLSRKPHHPFHHSRSVRESR